MLLSHMLRFPVAATLLFVLLGAAAHAAAPIADSRIGPAPGYRFGVESAASDEQFLATVINGRKGTQMPAFGLRLSIDEVWKVHAFVKSTDHY